MKGSEGHSGEEQRSGQKRAWFAHPCWSCGFKSREVDYIVGDGVYQCWSSNRDECDERRAALTPVEIAALPKPFSEPRRDWSPEARARQAEREQTLAAGDADVQERRVKAPAERPRPELGPLASAHGAGVAPTEEPKPPTLDL